MVYRFGLIAEEVENVNLELVIRGEDDKVMIIRCESCELDVA